MILLIVMIVMMMSSCPHVAQAIKCDIVVVRIFLLF